MHGNSKVSNTEHRTFNFDQNTYAVALPPNASPEDVVLIPPKVSVFGCVAAALLPNGNVGAGFAVTPRASWVDFGAAKLTAVAAVDWGVAKPNAPVHNRFIKHICTVDILHVFSVKWLIFRTTS